MFILRNLDEGAKNAWIYTASFFSIEDIPGIFLQEETKEYSAADHEEPFIFVEGIGSFDVDITA